MFRVIVVEDDEQLKVGMETLLRNNGYDVVLLHDFSHVTDDIIAAAPDLVVLDLNLPGTDGQYVCKSLRAASNVPIIVVTSRDNDMDELLSLNFGADDFIAKPFNPPVLLAHIAAVLNRSHGKNATGALISHGGITLDIGRCRVSCDSEEVELTKNELQILTLLLRNAGSVVPRQRIQEELWQSDEFVDDNTLSVNVSHLRQKLDGIKAVDFIRTKRGIGYLIE